MSNPDHLAVLQDAIDKKDVVIWNYWRVEHHDVKPDLSGADLRNARLRNADLRNAHLRNADLRNAHLSDADLRNADLSGAHLRRARLDWAALNGAHLVGADLSEVDLSEAELVEANLSEADVSGANLDAANLTWADLTRANFSGTHLGGTRLNMARLSDADFTGALFNRTGIVDVDLRTVKGLEATRHVGPSYIDISTLYKSAGDITGAFLHGAGVPVDMITYVRHQLSRAQAVPFYSVFISNSFHDQDLAERLHANLQAQGIRVWFSPRDLNIDDPPKQAIDQTVRLYDKLILVLSANSLERAWVRYQVSRALEKEKQHNRLVLFPIRLDNSVIETAEPWAYDIRGRPIGDFTRWKDLDEYQKAFERLLGDLNGG